MLLNLMMRFANMPGNEIYMAKLKNQIICKSSILTGEDFRFGKNREFGIKRFA